MPVTNVTPEQDTISQAIVIAAPRERVFQALTDAKQLFTWWGSEPSVELTVFNMDARKGGKYEYRCRPKASADFGEVGEQLKKSGTGEFICQGQVVEIEPARLLVWTWLANWHEHPDSPTTVRWELTPAGEGTRVQVIHSGLANEPISRKDYGQGWQGVLNLLKKYLEK